MKGMRCSLLTREGIVMDSGAGARCRQEIEDGSRFPRPGGVRSAVARWEMSFSLEGTARRRVIRKKKVNYCLLLSCCVFWVESRVSKSRSSTIA